MTALAPGLVAHSIRFFHHTAAGVDQPVALSPLTTIIATASQPAVSTSSLPADPAQAPAPTNRKLLQAAPAPAPQPAASTGGAGKLNPDFAIAEESKGSSSSMVSTGGWLGGWASCRGMCHFVPSRDPDRPDL